VFRSRIHLGFQPLWKLLLQYFILKWAQYSGYVLRVFCSSQILPKCDPPETDSAQVRGMSEQNHRKYSGFEGTNSGACYIVLYGARNGNVVSVPKHHALEAYRGVEIEPYAVLRCLDISSGK
jgi:hypothetical protein